MMLRCMFATAAATNAQLSEKRFSHNYTDGIRRIKDLKRRQRLCHIKTSECFYDPWLGRLLTFSLISKLSPFSLMIDAKFPLLPSR